MSSWGIWMELLRIVMRAPYHQGKGSLHLAHANGPPLRHATQIIPLGEEFYPADASPSPISHIQNSIRPTFHLLRISHIQNSIQLMLHLLQISHIRNSIRPTFHLLRIYHIGNSVRSDMSGSSESAYPESIRSPQFRFSGQLGSSDTHDSPDPFSPIIKKQTLIILTTKSPFLHSAKEFLLKLPDISDRLFEIFCFRYLMSKSPNSPCNPPIIGFLSL